MKVLCSFTAFLKGTAVAANDSEDVVRTKSLTAFREKKKKVEILPERRRTDSKVLNNYMK